MKKFENLRFKPFNNGVNAHHIFDNKFEISVSASKFAYCTPREDNLDSSQYTSFEVAIINPDGEFCTGEVLHIEDSVIGWQGREQITNIIETINKL